MSNRSSAADPLDGVWDYVSPLRGSAMFQEGRFIYLFGRRDRDSLVTGGSGGTYVIRGDTVTNTYEYHTQAGRVGKSFSFVFTLRGDTFTVSTLTDSAGVTILSDRAVPPVGGVTPSKSTLVRRR